MFCPRTEDISAWLDGELPNEEARFLEEHISFCDVCQAERESLQTLSGLFESMKSSRPSDPVPMPRRPHQRMRILAAAALVPIGVGALLGLAVELTDDELRFEAYLDRSVDRDVYEVSSLIEGDISRDKVVGLLISSAH
jgi:anti-sigma factor RsiW